MEWEVLYKDGTSEIIIANTREEIDSQLNQQAISITRVKSVIDKIYWYCPNEGASYCSP